MDIFDLLSDYQMRLQMPEYYGNPEHLIPKILNTFAQLHKEGSNTSFPLSIAKSMPGDKFDLYKRFLEISGPIKKEATRESIETQAPRKAPSPNAFTHHQGYYFSDYQFDGAPKTCKECYVVGFKKFEAYPEYQFDNSNPQIGTLTKYAAFPLQPRLIIPIQSGSTYFVKYDKGRTVQGSIDLSSCQSIYTTGMNSCTTLCFVYRENDEKFTLASLVHITSGKISDENINWTDLLKGMENKANIYTLYALNQADNYFGGSGNSSCVDLIAKLVELELPTEQLSVYFTSQSDASFGIHSPDQQICYWGEAEYYVNSMAGNERTKTD